MKRLAAVVTCVLCLNGCGRKSSGTRGNVTCGHRAVSRVR